VKVLAVGAHPDDIELGCGGALLAHQARGDEITLLVMTTGEQGPQHARSRIQEQEDAASLLDCTLLWGGFRDGAVPMDRAAVSVVHDAMAASGADLVYGHAPSDTTLAAVLQVARRPRRLLMYESPTTMPVRWVEDPADDPDDHWTTVASGEVWIRWDQRAAGLGAACRRLERS